uniref:Uncharacterized protein n=1 Tax=Romanomermis culicivorax TaxID=13658 RepID=A0A915JG22_ROMCU
MKVDDDIATDKLVIDEDIAETSDLGIVDSKEVISFSTDEAVKGLYSAKVVQNMREKEWNDERILFMAERKKKMRLKEKKKKEEARMAKKQHKILEKVTLER